MKNLQKIFFLAILFFSLFSLVETSQAAEVSGALKVWQPVMISFSGPAKNESDSSPNPFLDYRLQVTFSGPGGEIYNIPGYFDGDGNGGGSGDVWRVKFTPDTAGDWNYSASFRQGTAIAISLDQNAGTATSFDGESGNFNVAGRDPSALGFLGRGRLAYVGESYFQTLGDGQYWIKGGADEPENFLAYAGFDGTSANPDAPQIFHSYASHIADWQAGDPDWGGGKGKGIIGALNYLALKNVNSIYFLLMNIGGDGRDVWPYAGAINRAGSVSNDNSHFDISKLNQWNIVFEHANKKGINLHVVLNEAEINNKKELDDAALGIERKLYYREMAARFGYLNGLVWNLCEEYDHDEFPLSASMIKSWAGYLKSVDGHSHPVGVHNAATNGWNPFFGDSRLDFVSYQYYQDPPYEVNAGNSHYGDRTEELISAGAQAGKIIPVGMDEFWLAKRADDESHDDYTPVFPNNWPFASGNKFLRKNIIWPVYFSGGQLEYITEDYLATDDFSLYAKLWDYTWFARKFMLENIPFWEMSPADSLLAGEAGGYQEDGQVLAKAGEVYAAYLPDASLTGTLDLRAASGSFQKSWYNPRTGQFAGGTTTISGGSNIPLGQPPGEANEDWVVLIKKNTTDNVAPAAPQGLSVQ